MTTSRYLWADPADHSRAIRDAGTVDDGVVLSVVRPHRRPYTFHQDVLAAIGARHDVRGANARSGAGRELALVESWLAGYRVDTVVLAHADMIGVPAWIGPVADAVEAAGADLVLVSDDSADGPFADWCDANGMPVETGLDPSLCTVRASGHEPPAERAGRPFPVHVPRAAFYVWRARARDTLPPADFAVVDRLYRSVFASVVADPPGDADTATRTIASLLADKTGPGECVTVVRATQAAMFTSGFFLNLVTNAALAAVRANEHRRLDGHEIRSLRAYAEPWVGTAVLLHDAGMEYGANMSRLRLRHVTPDGTLTGNRRDAWTFHDDAIPFLRAQRHLRVLEGAGPDDPFLARSGRDVADAVRWARSDLNLSGTAHASQPDQWVKSLRLTVTPVGRSR